MLCSITTKKENTEQMRFCVSFFRQMHAKGQNLSAENNVKRSPRRLPFYFEMV
jgi:hypothetical protein